MLPRVAIVWLCYNNLEHLAAVVASWEKLAYPKELLSIYILPAESPDGIIPALERDVLPRSGNDLPELILINEANRGFAVNTNVGIRAAIAGGAAYVYLQNGDLRLDAQAIDEAVAVAETSPAIASVQSLARFWHDEQKVNVSGGMIHMAGYGYARDNGRPLADITVQNGDDIAYSSGAAVLYRATALQQVGLLEEGFYMYHEDLELGLRLRIAGFRNVIATASFAFHDYKFSGRNPKKFAWMELYRWVVILAYYKVRTLLVLAPLLLAVELGSWLLAAKGAGLSGKLYAYRELARPATWRLIRRIRQRAAALRVIDDRQYLCLFTGEITAQETSSPLMEKLVNPTVNGIWKMLRACIVW